MRFNEWVNAGKPIQKILRRGKVVMGPPQGSVGISCYCDPVAEMKGTVQDRLDWHSACPQCKGQFDLKAGMAYSESAQAFVGPGVSLPDARIIEPTPPKAITTQSRSSPVQTAPAIGPTGVSFAPAGATSAPMPNTSSGGGTMPTTRTARLNLPTGGVSSSGFGFTGVGAGIGTVIGGPIGGAIGGAVGGAFSPGGVFGGSKCKGPFNYNPLTGGCDPKPGSFAGPTCPAGTTWDAQMGQCKKGGFTGWVQETLPGGQTGYVDPIGEWTSTGAYGTTGVVPQARSTQTLMCPRGYVLYGKQPGMEVCMPKGMLPNKLRKWPKSPNPALSAQDMKTLRRIGTLQRRIKRVAGNAGFTVRKR